MKISSLFCSAGLVLQIVGASVSAQEWTRFRGPNGAGISHAKTIPSEWSDKDFNWKVALPGQGHSSPVLWGEKVFLLSGDERAGGVMVQCLSSEDGRSLWKKTFPFPLWRHHEFNSFASSSPAVDGDRVYVCWTTPGRNTLMALDHDGNHVWERDLGLFESQHGGGTSPILYRDLVVLANDQLGESYLIALDAATGKTRWKTERKSVRTAYSTPCVYQPSGQAPQLIFNSQAHGITGVDPATGKVLWEYADAFDKRSVSSPVIASGLIIGSCGSGGGGNYVVAVQPPDSSSEKPSLAFEVRRSAPYVPSALAVGDLLFLWSDAGIVTCVHAPSGETRWQERAGVKSFGSPVCIDGRIFCIGTEGEVVVLEASEKFRILARNSLGEKTHTTPAVAGGRLYIRTEGHLISIGG